MTTQTTQLLINQLYQLIKSKRISPTVFNDFIHDNQLDMDLIQLYKNSWDESILTYSIKYGFNIEFFDFLYDNGFILTGNYYDMTPIDICVTYNKNNTSQKLLILDWLYNKNIQFNPYYLLLYPRDIIKWIRTKEWNIDINSQNEIGNTALHEVCKMFHPKQHQMIYNRFEGKNNSYDAFYVLLEMGANPNIQNYFNNTPIDYCLKNSLINNLNILYYFHYEISPEQIEIMIASKNYFRLIKHTLWLLNNYKMLNISYTKSQLEDILLTKIIEIQYEITSYSNEYNSLLSQLNNKLYFDKIYNIKMFDIEENMFF